MSTQIIDDYSTASPFSYSDRIESESINHVIIVQEIIKAIEG